jgi:NAD-dependent DNA ligase/DNA polymerase/3'-5' exonuclease PolX
MTKSNIKKPKGQTKKKLLIIETSSISERDRGKSITKKNIKRKNVTQKKKPLLIIETSTPEKVMEEKVIEKKIIEKKENGKEKIEMLLPEKMKTNKIDLKIPQEVKQMSHIPAATQLPGGPQLPTGRLNEKFIELMEKLAEIMLKQGEPFRARAYQKAQETIMAYPSDILSPNDLKGKPGIGETIMEKLNEYVQTGTLKVLEREKTNPVNILADVYGIGPKKAKDLVDKGITSIAQLRENQHLLNDVQKVGLKFYEDILKRIPRSEIEDYKAIFDKAFTGATDAKMEIVGSYRRGAQSSGDIDVIITSKSQAVFTTFVDNLIKEKVILHVLSRGPTKCLVITKIPSSDAARRVDFLYTTPDEFPFAILYFTGSKIFNTVMRHVALEKGYTMNEHGIYSLQGETKKKGEKVDRTFKSEEDIFDFLGLQYKSPIERTDGRAIVVKTSVPDIKPLVSEVKPLLKPLKPKLIIEDSDTESEGEEYVLKPVAKKEPVIKKKAIPTEKKALPGVNKKIMIVDDEKEDETYKNIANDFKKSGISVLEALNEKKLSQLLREANSAYYNEEPFFTDNQYDIVKEFVEKKYPSNPVLHEIGAPVERNKVNLPYPMGSMDKIKPDTNALVNWTAKYKGPYVLSCKLDGVSGLYTTEGGVSKLYTRGDGKVGQDVSHLIPYLRLPKTKGIVIRGEFIIPRALFEAKYKDKFANPRNMVAGIVNHKTINQAIKDLHFVAYEVMKPIKKPSEQMALLLTLDVETVLYKVEPNLTNELLSKTLLDWRYNYAYEIDGVIVANDAVYERKPGNPEHAFAFKMVLSDQVAEAKVVDVIWAASKDGYLKPRVQIEPINLGGVQITYATGFNGAFINDNKIGIGATIELIRSGDVIPYIRKVVVPAEEAKMPSVPFKWNDTHVDIMLEDLGSDETVREKNITGFFRGIGVEGLSTGNIKRIMEAGYDSVPKILNMKIEDFLQVDGFKEKTATKLYDGIREKIEAAPLTTIMSASNMFGRGFSEKKIELIMESYPQVLLSKETNSQKVAKITAIKGMASKSAEAFVERIVDFVNFVKEAGLVKKLGEEGIVEKKEVDQSHPLFGKSIVMTGFRDVNLQEALKNVGAKIGSSVSSKTFVVLVKDKEEDTGKANEGRKLGITLMTPEEFTSKYLS